MDEFAAAANTNEGADNNCCGDNENFVDTPNEASTDRVGVFCCRDCGEGFREEAAYLEHRRLHPQPHAHLAEQSDGLLKKDSETPHICSFCSLSFVNMSELHLHMKNHDQDPSKDPNTLINPGVPKQHQYECPDCGKSYVVIGHFLNHQRSHQQPSKSVFHDLEHLKKKSFQCETCGRNYSRASALDAHRRCHEEKLIKSKNRNSGDMVKIDRCAVEVKPSEGPTETEAEKCHKCLCGKGFSTVLRLKTHQRFSRNSQCSPEEIKQKAKKTSNEFHCSECNKYFNGHIALFNHQRWHANHSDDSAKRFSCEACGKVFMTLTFYYRHQRTAHSDETPAKSFLHQVCQLQKKAFECKDCGLKFSRASALHSHQLQHTDVFRETEKEAQMRSPLLPLSEMPECGWEATQHSGGSTEGQGLTESSLPAAMPEESHISEADEDSESYEPGDFNVQVISASEDEDDADQDPNPDLELLCESDQDVRDDCDAEAAPRSLVLKPEMDLKIVRLDFGHMDEQRALLAWEAEGKADEERHDCPECYRWFPSPSSLRVHRMWHDVHKRRQQTQVKEFSITCKDCGLVFTHMGTYKTHLHQHALEEEEAQMGDEAAPAAGPAAGILDDAHGRDGDTSGDADVCDVSRSAQTQPSEFLQEAGVHTASTKSTLGKVYACLICGKIYTYLVSFQKHQKQHDSEPAEEKRLKESDQNLRKYECPDCGMSFIRRSRLIGHLRVHRSNRRYKATPAKCDQCNKYFTSAKSWLAHLDLHKQKRFWCLSCAQGFLDEVSLDKHLQNHGLRQHRQNIIARSPYLAQQLTSHLNTHERVKPHQCPCCGDSFWHPGELLVHRQKHCGVDFRISGNPPESSAFEDSEEDTQNGSPLTGFKDDAEIKTALPDAEELLQNQEKIERNEDQSLLKDPEVGGPEDSEESDCGEPVHCFQGTKPTGCNDPSDRKKSEQELGENEPNKHREHKYWEWECTECDMGFDEMAMLHLHYIQHATGEVPIPHHDLEG